MASLNRVMILGHLGRDPELRTSNSGTAIAKLSVATTERRKVGDSYEDHTDWHRITVFGKTAENVAKFKRKGDQLFVEGRIEYGEYESDGVKRFTTDIIAERVVFVGSRGAASEASGNTDDNIPF